MSPAYLTEIEAAALLRLAPKTLRRWRSAGFGPAYRKFGWAVRYAVTDLDSFAARNTRGDVAAVLP